MSHRTSAALTLILTGSFLLSAGEPMALAADPDVHPSGAIAEQYRADAEKIVTATLQGNEAYDKLEHLCVQIGHRLSGSEALEQAIDWAIDTMKKDGQTHVRREMVMVPHWVRGNESATLVSPRYEPFHMLGLGGSVGTPPGGITAPVIVVADEDELNAVADVIPGKIVLFNKVMPPYDPQLGAGYGPTVKYRTQGARLAAEKGAVAALVRSVTANSLRTPHTGAMRYGDAKKKIPTAAVSVEDAELLLRLQQMGTTPVVNLRMNAKTLPDAVSANVIGELRGRELPDEIVVIGGHIDAWDVGQGAHDDGGGCIIAMEAINVLRKLNMIPRRTIRVVLWTNEENGLAGGRAYAKDHENELDKHVAAIESDSGIFAPRGFGLSCSDENREAVAVEQMSEILGLLSESIGGLEARAGGGGADIGPMRGAGVVLIGHRVEGSKYFNYHHTEADTIDKVDPTDLSQNVAVMAVTAYILADMPNKLGTRSTP